MKVHLLLLSLMLLWSINIHLMLQETAVKFVWVGGAACMSHPIAVEVEITLWLS